MLESPCMWVATDGQPARVQVQVQGQHDHPVGCMECFASQDVEICMFISEVDKRSEGRNSDGVSTRPRTVMPGLNPYHSSTFTVVKSGWPPALPVESF